MPDQVTNNPLRLFDRGFFMFAGLTLALFLAAVFATIFESQRLNAAPHGYYVVEDYAIFSPAGRSRLEPPFQFQKTYIVRGPYATWSTCDKVRSAVDSVSFANRNEDVNVYCQEERDDDAANMPRNLAFPLRNRP